MSIMYALLRCSIEIGHMIVKYQPVKATVEKKVAQVTSLVESFTRYLLTGNKDVERKETGDSGNKKTQYFHVRFLRAVL